MLFTTVTGGEKKGNISVGGEGKNCRIDGQEIRNDDPLQYTNLDLIELSLDQLLTGGADKSTHKRVSASGTCQVMLVVRRAAAITIGRIRRGRVSH